MVRAVPHLRCSWRLSCLVEKRSFSGSSGELWGYTTVRCLAGRTWFSHPKRRKKETRSMVAERNGVRGGTKLPPRVAESAPLELAPPGGGPTGAAFQALGPAPQPGSGRAKPPTTAAPTASIAHSSPQLRPPPSVIPLPGYKGALLESQASRGKRLRVPG